MRVTATGAGSLRWVAIFAAVFIVAAIARPPAASAEQDASALAKAAQNPIASMISVPFQNNMNFDAGPDKKMLNVLNIQPVYPVTLSEEWNVITRTIVPVISQPGFAPGQDRKNGIGDIQFSAFFSPSAPSDGGWIWGAGFIAQLDTATDDRLGQGKWGLGPTAVALRSEGPWLFGALINNIWDVAGSNAQPDVHQLLVQPFINYNFEQWPGTYLTFAPVITSDWEADSGNRWTVPLGLGIGRIMKLGQQPVNLQASAYYNVERPDLAPNWQLRLQLQLLFPK